MRHIQLFLFHILFHYLFCQNRVVNIMVSNFFWMLLFSRLTNKQTCFVWNISRISIRQLSTTFLVCILPWNKKKLVCLFLWRTKLRWWRMWNTKTRFTVKSRCKSPASSSTVRRPPTSRPVTPCTTRSARRPTGLT